MSLFSDISALVVQAKLQTRTLENIEALLADIKTALVPRPAAGAKIFLGTKEVTTVGFQLQDVQTVPLTIQWVDADENPTTQPPPGMTGPPVWSTSDPAMATVTPAPDGMSAVVAGGSKLGDAQVNMVVPGTNPPITAQFPVTIVAGPPVGATLVPGTPSP